MSNEFSRERFVGSRRFKALLTGIVIVAVFVGALAAQARASTTFTVNLPGDTKDGDTTDGLCDVNLFGTGQQCTLRAAIEQANATPGADVIRFAIPDDFGAGVKTINVGATGNGALPPITQTVTIDGYTQPGAHPNTLAVGDDAQITIELNGSAAGPANGLSIRGASNSVIRGLAINRFATGIAIESGDPFGDGSALDNRVEGNFIGTDPSGTQDLGNSLRGVGIFNATSSNNTIGGTTPAARNLISGNDGIFGGVELFAGTSGNNVQGNYVGTDRTGTRDLGNAEEGIVVDGNNNTVGGILPGAGNLISGNGTTGVLISGGTLTGNNRMLGNRIGTTVDGTAALGNGSSGVRIEGRGGNSVGDGTAAGSNTIAFNGSDGVTVLTTGNRISRNTIFSNAGSGIDLGNDGPTPNDGDNPNTPLVDPDSDVGANGLQNFPVLSSAKKTSTGTTISGKLTSTPGKTYKVRFFSNPSATDEGKRFLGQKSVATNANGDAPFSFSTSKAVSAGQTITATATDTAGNTSEFSAPRTVALSTGNDLTPDTTKVSGPSGTTKSPAALFRFFSPDPDATFECSLDGGAYYPCSSPENVNKLSEGRHSFSVRAVDGEGNADQSPAAWIWSVERNDG